MKMTKLPWLATPVAAALVLTACQSTPEMRNRPGFLTAYNHLQKVDDTTYRYVSPQLLALCNKFTVSPVKVLFNEYQGKPLTAEQRQRTADFVRQTVINALADRYPIVSEPGADVAEIRLAITDVYRTGGKTGVSIEGEVLDNSNTQVAAVTRSELSELYVPSWEDKAAAREVVQDWAKRLRAMIDQSRGK